MSQITTNLPYRMKRELKYSIEGLQGIPLRIVAGDEYSIFKEEFIIFEDFLKKYWKGQKFHKWDKYPLIGTFDNGDRYFTIDGNLIIVPVSY